MNSAGPTTYRRHAAQFKLQLCQDIRSGELGRRDAQKKYNLSANLIQLWLTHLDNGELTGEEVETSMVIDYEAKISALERKVGKLALVQMGSASGIRREVSWSIRQKAPHSKQRAQWPF